ncbi:Phospholipid-transporting ATPase [Fasciola gigantica]|uniref:Phospholipid-transporting ATPase n=1 Tax=Fasciola gigantica TaxID=46835 RepID=A0A504YVQ9_FASGI|nr:Phospholipid-transporting ATPase [Fasciola gigantica]
MSLLSPSESQRESSDTPGSSSSSSTDRKNAYVEDFILALAICNTAVVSATKNAASLFQIPTRRRGLRNLFRSSPNTNATNRPMISTTTSATSKRRRRKALSSKTDAEDSASVKHALSLGSIFVRRHRRSPRTNDVAAVPQLELPHEGDEISMTESTRPESTYDGLALAAANLPNADGPLHILTLQPTDPLNNAGEKSSADLQSKPVPLIAVLEPDSGCSIPLGEPDRLLESQLPSSTQSLPPVVRGLQLDLPTPRALHSTRPRELNVRWQITDDSILEGETNPIPVDSELPEGEGDTVRGSSTDVQIHELRPHSSRTLTVVAHDGVSYDLPVSEDFVPESMDPSACPLSDNTLYGSYESESPDELSLVRAACQQGCKLLQRGVDFVLLWLPTDGLIALRVLHILPFDSVRKRMSILVRHPATNEAVLYTKGADTAILDRTRTTHLLTCHLHATLCGQTWPPRGVINDVMSDGPDLTDSSSVSTCSSSEMKNMNRDKHAGPDDQNHDDMMTYTNNRRVRLCDPPSVFEIEADSTVARHRRRIRRCASESRIHSRLYRHRGLLDENTGTGDAPAPDSSRLSRYRRGHRHRHRSRSRSHSRHRRSRDHSRIRKSHSHHPQHWRVHIRQRSRPFSGIRKSSLHEDTLQLALVIDGETLQYALDDDNKANFLRLSRFCSSVLCCRSTPAQKAAVVSLVKEGLKVQTLAIGDGANDVNMIQVANVGVGIGGQEGMQAVMASDFAISRFAFLERLVLVHGHLCYDKLAHTALYLFYKDAVYIFLLFWFQLFNGFSGSNAIDQLSQILFSITFTGLPSLLMGIWDNPIDSDTLMANPILYRAGIQGKSYRPWLFWINILDAVWQALIIFFIPYLFYADSSMTMWRYGVLQTNILVICSLLHAALVTRTWVIFHWVGLIASYLMLWVFFTMIYHSVAVTGIQPESPYRVIFVAMHDGPFWLLTVVTTAVALLPRLMFITLKNTFNPSWDTVAGLLTKRYGRGKRLPLEPYIFGPFTTALLGSGPSPPRVSRTESIRSTPSHITPLEDSADTSNGAYGSRMSVVSVMDGTEPTEQTAQFMSRVGQLFTVSGRLLRGVPPSPTASPIHDNGSTPGMVMLNNSRGSPLSMVNLRASMSHMAVDSRRRRRRTHTIHHTQTPRHLRNLGLSLSNNFDDEAGGPANPVIWPAVNPSVRAHSLSTRHCSISRLRPSIVEARHQTQASSLPAYHPSDDGGAFPTNPTPSDPNTSSSSRWMDQMYRTQWLDSSVNAPALGLFDPPPPYSLDDLPDPQECYRRSLSGPSVQNRFNDVQRPSSSLSSTSARSSTSESAR